MLKDLKMSLKSLISHRKFKIKLNWLQQGQTQIIPQTKKSWCSFQEDQSQIPPNTDRKVHCLQVQIKLIQARNLLL